MGGDQQVARADGAGSLIRDAVVQRRIDGAVIWAPADDHIGGALAHGWYEADLLGALEALGPEGVAVDVGAYVGSHAVYLALHTSVERVIAIEPNPESFALLQMTVMANDLEGRVECVQAAVHPEWRTATIVPGPAGNQGMTRVEDGGDDGLRVVSLDTLLDGLDVGLIKIDVEGMAASVLASARETIARCAPILAVEVTAGEEGDVRDALAALGYTRSASSYGWTPVWIWMPPADRGIIGPVTRKEQPQ